MTDKADEKPEGNVKTTQARPAGAPPAQSKPAAPPLQEPPAGGAPDAGAEAPKPAPERKPWEQWAKEKRAPAGELLSAKTLHRWPVGKQITEADFDAAITAARNLVFR